MKQRSAIWKQPRNFTAGLFYSVSPIQNQYIVSRAQDVKVERRLSSQYSMCYCYQGSKMGSLIILCHPHFILVPLTWQTLRMFFYLFWQLPRNRMKGLKTNCLRIHFLFIYVHQQTSWQLIFQSRNCLHKHIDIARQLKGTSKLHCLLISA